MLLCVSHFCQLLHVRYPVAKNNLLEFYSLEDKSTLLMYVKSVYIYDHSLMT